MELKEQVYSVLIVSSAENFTNAVSSMLPSSEYKPIVHSSNVVSAKRTLAQRSFDFVIINSPLSDDLGAGFAADCVSSGGAVVLMLINSEIHDEVHAKVSKRGVFTLSKPISYQTMRTALKWLETAKELTKKYEKKTTSIEDKMLEIRTVNKAKWILIDKKNMTEPEAHRYLEKEAMDRCISKKAVANEIIEKYE